MSMLPDRSEPSTGDTGPALFDVGAIGVVELDASGAIVQANRAFNASLGLADATGLALASVIAESDRSLVAAMLAEVGRRCSAGRDLRYRRADGTTGWARVDAAALVDRSVPGAEGSRTIALFRDITETKVAAESMHATTTRLRQVIEQAPVSLVTMDLSGRLLSWNPAAKALFGWDADEVLGRPLPTVDTSDRWFDAIGAEVDEHLGTNTFETTLLHKDGTPTPTLLCVAALRDGGGTPTAYTCLASSLMHPAPAERALVENEQRWHLLTQQVQDAIIVTDADGIVVSVSRQLGEIMGPRRESLVGCGIEDLVLADQRDPILDLIDALHRWPQLPVCEEFRVKRNDDTRVYVELNGVNRIDELGALVFTARNVTVRHRALALQSGQAAVFEDIANGVPLEHTLLGITRVVEQHLDGVVAAILRVDDDLVRVGAGPNLPEAALAAIDNAPPSQWFGAWRGALVGAGTTSVDDIADSESYGDLAPLFTDAGLTASLAIPIEDPEARKPVATLVLYFEQPPTDNGPALQVAENATQLAAIAIQRHRNELRLAHLAHHDKLTGLPNRALLQSRLENAVRHAARHGSSVSLMFVDLDDFKLINDSLGHAAGDQVLVGFADRLHKLIRPGDTVARFGGDEFVVLLENVEGIDDATPVAERLLDELRRPFRIGDKEIFLTVSVGIATAEGDSSTDLLLRHADAAMYRAKEQGRARIELYDELLPSRHSKQIQLESDLNHALANNEFELYWQPKVSLETGRMISVETLLRWNHPTLGLRMPAEFIDTAEETGLISAIGRWVLSQALRQATDLLAFGPPGQSWSIAVNLSGRQLSAPRFVGEVASILRQWSWPASKLILELTESVLMDDATDSPLHHLQQFGLQMAIDDFGTGYSSLSYLHRFPVAMVKLDMAFVSSIQANGEGSPIAKAVIQMAHALGLTATAEGVETADQLEGLRVLGCDWVQGFHVARPMPTAQFAEWLQADHRF